MSSLLATRGLGKTGTLLVTAGLGFGLAITPPVVTDQGFVMLDTFGPDVNVSLRGPDVDIRWLTPAEIVGVTLQPEVVLEVVAARTRLELLGYVVTLDVVDSASGVVLSGYSVDLDVQLDVLDTQQLAEPSVTLAVTSAPTVQLETSKDSL